MKLRQLSPSRIITYFVLLVWSAICILPLYWVLLASFKSEDAIMQGPRYIAFVDFKPNLDAWYFILLDSHENLLQPLWNSLVVSVVATSLAVFLACLMLYSLTRFRRDAKTKSWLLLLVLSSRILPPVSMVIALYMAAKFAGLLDTRTALVITYSAINLPVATWLLLPAFGSRATEQEEAAILEGVSHIGILRGILLPMLLPTLLSVALIIFVLCWNEYIFAVYLTTNEASTLTPWMVGQLSMKEAQIGGEPEEWAHLSAATVLMVTPLLLFSSIAMRLLARRSTQ